MSSFAGKKPRWTQVRQPVLSAGAVLSFVDSDHSDTGGSLAHLVVAAAIAHLEHEEQAILIHLAGWERPPTLLMYCCVEMMEDDGKK